MLCLEHCFIWLRDLDTKKIGALAEVGDFKIGGRIINKVRFADDKAIKTKEELQDMVNRQIG